MRKSLRGRRIVAVGTLVALLAATTAAPALAAVDPVQGALDTLTAQDGVPGAAAVVQDGSRMRVTRSGTGDVATGKPFPRNGSFRAGSMTKSFVASIPLSCGEFWGREGGILGFTNLSGVGPSGRRATVVLNQNPTPPAANQHLLAATDAAICSVQ